MRDHTLQKRAWLLCLPLLVGTPPALAQDQLVDLQSSGGYTSYRLADDVTQVDLVEQTQGACRFNRTWGYDLTNRELWTNGGCGGRFKITRTYASGNNSGSNAGAAVAAVAAIAGIALLANHNRHDTTGAPSTRATPARAATGGARSAWMAACASMCGVASSSLAPPCRCTNATVRHPSVLQWGAAAKSAYATCASMWTVVTHGMALGWCCGPARARAARAGSPGVGRS